MRLPTSGSDASACYLYFMGENEAHRHEQQQETNVSPQAHRTCRPPPSRRSRPSNRLSPAACLVDPELRSCAVDLPAGEARRGCGVGQATLYRHPRFEEASTLDLLRIAGFIHPERLVVLLDRLTNRLALLHEYRRWEPLMLDKHVAGFITSMRTQLTPRKLDALSQLEPDLRSARIMKQVRSKDDVLALDVIVAWVCRHCPAASPADVRQSLRSTRSDIDDWLEEWLMTAQLPPPPFPGTDLLVPLRTGADIKHAAQEFRNCLNSLLQDAVTGRVAFYVW